jgi:hypothetical protein
MYGNVGNYFAKLAYVNKKRKKKIQINKFLKYYSKGGIAKAI